MSSKSIQFFLLDPSKATSPQQYGMQVKAISVMPLYDALVKDARIVKLTYSDATAYSFSFFRKPFMTEILMLVTEGAAQDRKAQLRSQILKAKEILNPKSDEYYHPEYLRRGLWLPRAIVQNDLDRAMRIFSGLGAEDVPEYTRWMVKNFWLANTPGGLVFGGSQENDLLKSCALYALALSYQYRLSRQISRIAAAFGGEKESLAAALRDALIFRTRYFFSNPVKPSDHDLYTSFAFVSQGCYLDKLEAEHTKKINAARDLMQLFSLGEDKEAANFDEEKLTAVASGRQTSSPKPVLKHDSTSVNWKLFLLIGLGLVGAGAGYLWLTDPELLKSMFQDMGALLQ